MTSSERTEIEVGPISDAVFRWYNQSCLCFHCRWRKLCGFKLVKFVCYGTRELGWRNTSGSSVQPQGPKKKTSLSNREWPICASRDHPFLSWRKKKCWTIVAQGLTFPRSGPVNPVEQISAVERCVCSALQCNEQQRWFTDSAPRPILCYTCNEGLRVSSSS